MTLPDALRVAGPRGKVRLPGRYAFPAADLPALELTDAARLSTAWEACPGPTPEPERKDAMTAQDIAAELVDRVRIVPAASLLQMECAARDAFDEARDAIRQLGDRKDPDVISRAAYAKDCWMAVASASLALAVRFAAAENKLYDEA